MSNENKDLQEFKKLTDPQGHNVTEADRNCLHPVQRDVVHPDASDVSYIRKFLLSKARWLGDATIDELTQDALLKCHEKRHEYDPNKSSWRTWAIWHARTILNHYLKRSSTKLIQDSVSLFALPDEGDEQCITDVEGKTYPSAEDVLIALEEQDLSTGREVLELKLDELKAPERDAMRLHIFDGLDNVAIGERLGCTSRAVACRLTRARQSLGLTLDDTKVARKKFKRELPRRQAKNDLWQPDTETVKAIERGKRKHREWVTANPHEAAAARRHDTTKGKVADTTTRWPLEGTEHLRPWQRPTPPFGDLGR